MPKTYEATITQTRELVFTFTDADIEGDDTIDEAAEELAQGYPQNAWDEVDFSVVVGPAEDEAAA